MQQVFRAPAAKFATDGINGRFQNGGAIVAVQLDAPLRNVVLCNTKHMRQKIVLRLGSFERPGLWLIVNFHLHEGYPSMMRLATTLVSLLLLAHTAAAQGCLPYEPAVVKLTGTLHKVKAYGPPNYGENPATDSREDYVALKLDQPICTLPSGNSIDLPEAGIRDVQLVFMGRTRTAPVGQHGTVVGKLMHAITGHHHTTVLIMVD